MSTHPVPTYTPGYSPGAVRFMARRTAATHAHFLLPHLTTGTRLLDLGCGPGTVTVGLAEVVAPGRVVGVDAAAGQAETARAHAERCGAGNVEFESGDAAALRFGPGAFDAVFAHALFEHLPDPLAVAREAYRVLAPSGVVGVCSPDWDGFLLAPADPRADAAVAAYRTVQTRAGGDTGAGRKLAGWLLGAGFTRVTTGAWYECYPDRKRIAEYLAARLDRETDTAFSGLGDGLRAWADAPGALFAQAWVWAVGHRPA
ncbi:class I SAM-dependent methyltransferase [Frigoriglobus tundricola]|uniref:Methyltransferase domain-containing protein n=1 Tax=Frigoriglobus tundricola TaxID=2774151 RepID=A0A6M5YJ64_9BACT|nr:methyltransferase domain-containing protein [Frigoriglobus tundricola]QJW93316.1 hypothetical protein FTUN_0822 [Frigoriglobus tundricola]